MAVLQGGQQLAKGGAPLASDDGRFGVYFQTDDNVVLYDVPIWRPLWATNTNGNNVAEAEMQTDGNFVLYHPGRIPLWATGTYNSPGATLNMQNDGNLVIYNAGGHPVWATSTVQGG